MKDRNPPPQPTAQWSPEQKMLWLAAKGAPPNFRLTSVEELAAVAMGVEAGQRQIVAVSAECKGAIQKLDEYGYWQEQPNLPHAAGAAAFDARRFERATTAAISRLESVEKLFALLAQHSQTPVEMLDIATEAGAVAETLTFLRAQVAARYERTA